MIGVPVTTPAQLLPRAAAALLASLLLLFALTLPAQADGRTLYVAPGHSDTNPGTIEAPFGTIDHALSQLRAGDTLILRGGTYRERVQGSLPSATADNPTKVMAMPGEQPVVAGLLWLRGGSHWVVDGVDVTWDPSTGAPNEHMFKVVNGTDWVVRNAEVYGAQSFAGMLVASTRTGEPSRWELSGNCFRDTEPSNATNQDHNLYVNTGLSAGPGLIEGNVFFGAPNGMNIKLGPPSETSGSANVVVRHNTLHDAAQNVLIARESRDNVVEKNIIGKAGPNYGNVRAYRITGHDNVARDNLGFAASSFILEYRGGNGIVDGGGNQFPVDPEFDRVDSCDGFRPTKPAAAATGPPKPEATTRAPRTTPARKGSETSRPTTSTRRPSRSWHRTTSSSGSTSTSSRPTRASPAASWPR
jgi:hypothetical protein